jgi:hypothetical protein
MCRYREKNGFEIFGGKLYQNIAGRDLMFTYVVISWNGY